jgi:uncharacterized membrane protein YeaQ/YmgE (transglycosylase-associated protein family)
MNLLAWIVVGAIAGWLAGYLTRTSEGLVGNIILGIVGGLLGGFVLNLVGFGGGVTGIDLPSIFTATVGAVLLIVTRRALTGSRR